jgi:hypothetical protein
MRSILQVWITFCQSTSDLIRAHAAIGNELKGFSETHKLRKAIIMEDMIVFRRRSGPFGGP